MINNVFVYEHELKHTWLYVLAYLLRCTRLYLSFANRSRTFWKLVTFAQSVEDVDYVVKTTAMKKYKDCKVIRSNSSNFYFIVR